MKHWQTLIVLLLSLISTSCVTPPPSIEGLRSVSSSKAFTLSERLIVRQKVAPLATAPAEVSLAEGVYVSEQENDAGTFFRGPTGCVMYEMLDGWQVASGGLWIPKDPKVTKMRMYIYMYTDATKFRDRTAALSRVDGSPVFGSIGAIDGKLEVVLVDSKGKINNTGKATGGTVIAGEIVNAMLASEVKNARGNPGFLWEVESPELLALRNSLK